MRDSTIATIATTFLAMTAAGQVREAFARYVAQSFRHHNAYFPDDRESLLVAMEQSAATEPNKAFTVKKVIEGDGHVVVYSHLQRANGGAQYAVVHMLRFDGERVVEMWDIAQAIPDTSPNALGMF